MSEKTIKVVICDDHGIYRQGIIHVLSDKKDIEVIGEAEDGLQLIKLLKHVQPDVILLDINMPVMDGTVALPLIKKNYPDTKVLVLSMQNTPQMIKIMMQLGADGYLTKNDNEELIHKAIVDCYSTGRYLDKRTEDILLDSIRGAHPVYIDESVDYTDPYTVSTPQNKKGTWKNYLWLIKAILTGIGIAVVVIAMTYVYLSATSIKDVKKSYIPPTYENNQNN
jgi:DNA-binding NarL/FixJ family response regulator